MKPSLLAFVLLFVAASAVGCAPAIGDECETALDCSSQGSRQCDRTQPGGYCTILGCEQGTCPEESVCVKFRPELERIAVTYCMATCETDSDCRGDEGYECKTQGTFADGKEATVLDGAGKAFCSVPLVLMSVPPEEDASVPDASVPDASAPDANIDDAGR
jgi:hypothetical protein